MVVNSSDFQGANQKKSMMPNTTYDSGQKGNNMIPQGSILDGVNLNQFESQSVAGSEKLRSSKYRKYGLKDYNNLKETLQNTKMGGLGANIGGEKWE